PENPDDTKGKPPLNLKYGFFVPSTKPDKPVALVETEPAEKVKLLAEAPKEFSGEPRPNLPSVSRPEIQAHLLTDPLASLLDRLLSGRLGLTGLLDRAANSRTEGEKGIRTITYDYGKQQFVRAGNAGAANRGKAEVVASLNGRGQSSISPGGSGGARGGGY